MQEIVIEIMNRFGYLGIGLLIVVETIFPPIPSEVILTFGGFLTTCSKMTIAGSFLYPQQLPLPAPFYFMERGHC